ncbi:uncharacterized protein ACNS7B_019702 isoform 2-T2 [Menidia menidia]
MYLVDTDCDADGYDLFYNSSGKVTYYWSFEYCLNWKGAMPNRRNGRQSKASKKNNEKGPVLNEDGAQRRMRSQRVRAWLKQSEAPKFPVDPDEQSHCDILDIIDISCGEELAADAEAGGVVEVADNGLDDSNEGGGSECSIASGPSFMHHTTSRQPKPPRALCAACLGLFERTKRAKAPVRNKVMDNDPQSLTCDRWVLVKKRMPRSLPNTRRGLLSLLQLDTEGKQRVEVSFVCSRPHVFLIRNLRCCTRVPAGKQRKKNRRKRSREDSQDLRVAKQQRLQRRRRSRHQKIAGNPTGPSPNSCSSSWNCSGQEIDSRAAGDPTAEAAPASVTQETGKAKDVRDKRESSKKTRGFRDLLAQLRGNSSMVVRETR